jgi:hypothetical protein
VLNHTVGWGFIALIWWTDRYRAVAVPNFDAVGGVNYWLLRAGEALAAFAATVTDVISSISAGRFAPHPTRCAGCPLPDGFCERLFSAR